MLSNFEVVLKLLVLYFLDNAKKIVAINWVRLFLLLPSSYFSESVFLLLICFLVVVFYHSDGGS